MLNQAWEECEAGIDSCVLVSQDLNGDGQITRDEWIKICPGFNVNEWLKGGMLPLSAHTL